MSDNINNTARQQPLKNQTKPTKQTKIKFQTKKQKNKKQTRNEVHTKYLDINN